MTQNYTANAEERKISTLQINYSDLHLPYI